MWWWWMDPEDAGKVVIFSMIAVILIFAGMYLFGGDKTPKKSDNYEVVYDTISTGIKNS